MDTPVKTHTIANMHIQLNMETTTMLTTIMLTYNNIQLHPVQSPSQITPPKKVYTQLITKPTACSDSSDEETDTTPKPSSTTNINIDSAFSDLPPSHQPEQDLEEHVSKESPPLAQDRKVCGNITNVKINPLWLKNFVFETKKLKQFTQDVCEKGIKMTKDEVKDVIERLFEQMRVFSPW
jgi:hypothetical protein